MDKFLVSLYITLWMVTFIWFRKRTTYFGAGSFVLATNLIYALFSFIYLGNMDDLFEVKGFTLFPFIYLFLSIIIFSSPVLKYELKNVNRIVQPRLFFIDAFSVAYIICSILVAPVIFKNLWSGLALIMLDANGGADLYTANAIAGSASSTDGGVSNLLVLFHVFFTDISIFVFFYYYTIKERRFWIQLGLGVTMIISTLHWISIGTRTGVMTNAFTMVTAYLLFSNFIKEGVKHKVKLFIVVVSILIMIPTVALTISRKGASALESVSLYFGQANLHFNKFGLDAGGLRGGDRTMGYFKYLLGINPRFIDGYELRQKYSYMDIDDGHFYTFVGDFTLDYGPIVTAVLFVVIALVMNRTIKYKKNEILFHHLILVFFIACIVIQGGMYLFTYSLQSNGTIIAFFLFYILFKSDYLLNRKSKITQKLKLKKWQRVLRRM